MQNVESISLHGDPRVEHRSANLNGCNYKYLYVTPPGGQFSNTVFLVHGWPDLSAAWRYQIPCLLKLGLRVIAMDMMGYGGTESPQDLSYYTYKRASDDIAALAKQLGCERIILGGHDWGGFVVYRAAAFYPQLITHIFSVCTPYTPPQDRFISLEEAISRVPHFGYQAHLASGEVEQAVWSPDQKVRKQNMRQFLEGAYGARTSDTNEYFFDPKKGLRLDLLGRFGHTKLLSENEMDYYASQYASNPGGLRGPCNWYRTRRLNFDSDQQFNIPRNLNVPTLLIVGLRDSVLKPEMAQGMTKFIPDLRIREVDTQHWALWEDPRGVNDHLLAWFTDVVGIGKDSGNSRM